VAVVSSSRPLWPPILWPDRAFGPGSGFAGPLFRPIRCGGRDHVLVGPAGKQTPGRRNDSRAGQTKACGRVQAGKHNPKGRGAGGSAGGASNRISSLASPKAPERPGLPVPNGHVVGNTGTGSVGVGRRGRQKPCRCRCQFGDVMRIPLHVSEPQRRSGLEGGKCCTRVPPQSREHLALWRHAVWPFGLGPGRPVDKTQAPIASTGCGPDSTRRQQRPRAKGDLMDRPRQANAGTGYGACKETGNIVAWR